MQHLQRIVLVALVATMAGCAGMQSPKPDSPEVQLTLSAVRLAAMVGCDQLANKKPEIVPQVEAGLSAAQQLMVDNADYTQVVAAIQLGIKDPRQAAYIGEAVRLVDQYVKSKTGVLTDANTVGYQAANAVIGGCRAGLAIHAPA